MASETDMSSEVLYHEHRGNRRDESRPLPQPLDFESIPSTLLELQPGMSKAVEICYDCWKVRSREIY